VRLAIFCLLEMMFASLFVLKDFLGELVVVLDKDVLVDVLAEGDLVDVPAEDVLEPNPWLDFYICGLRVVLGGDQAGLLPSSLQIECS
jgi:hypothetical protein